MGTPTTPGTYSFTITVSDSEDPQATFQQSFNLVIGGTLELTTPSPLTPNAAVGEYYSVQLAASGGTTPYSYSFVTDAGNVPPGLTLSSNGILSGTPTQYTIPAGGYNNFFVMVTDSSNPQLSSTFGMALQVQSTLQIVTPLWGTATGDQVLGLLHEAAAKFGATVLMATHSAEAAAIAQVRVNLRDGRIQSIDRT